MKEKVVEGNDFMLVNLTIIEFLNELYGVEGGTFKDFMRHGKVQDDGEVVIELRLRKVRLLAFPNKTKFK